MPTFFTFQQGTESRRPPPDSRYGRFRLLPDDIFRSSGYDYLNLRGARNANANRYIESKKGNKTTSYFPRSTYGAISGIGGRSNASQWQVVRLDSLGDEDEDIGDEEDGDNDDDKWWRWERWMAAPSKAAVRRIVGTWWSRFLFLVVLPAGVTILWCAVPFPTYPLNDDEQNGGNVPNSTTFGGSGDISSDRHAKGPGHGEALVRLDFWYFLFIYYGLYNFIGLMWITKLFNLYSLNWWPPRLGFPISYTIFWSLPLLLAIPLHLHPSLSPILSKNLTWIFLTFITMCCPLILAFLVLLFEHRHISLPQRQHILSPPLVQHLSPTPNPHYHLTSPSSYRIRSLPSSYIRFLWFCLTLLLTLLAFVLGEAYAELYLRTLPHNNVETVAYVYAWIATIHSLDALTAYILGTNSSGKVASYPLSFVFKFYFALTYQVYVRALYARLRSPEQFVMLQLVSSTIVVVYQPVSMTRTFHGLLSWLNLSGQKYEEYRKFVGRSFYLRGVAENVSMVAWLGWVLVLHYGRNKWVYPYFAFESGTGGWWGGSGNGNGNGNDNGEKEKVEYTFELTFWASIATWACEIVAGWIVRRIMLWGFGFEVTGEAKRDFVDFPELVGALVVVGVHVGQNMLVSILRVRF